MDKAEELTGQNYNILEELLLGDALYHYEFDVTTGIIEHDIISRDGTNYMELLGLPSPCRFNELIEHSFNGRYIHVEYTLDSSVYILSCEELLRAYQEGRKRIEVKLYLADKHQYNRLTYLLMKAEETGHIMAFVMCQDITEIEQQWIRENASARKELEETNHIISDAGIGTWKICLFDNEKPRMKGNAKMYELLGISPTELTEEEVYDFWYAGIRKSSLPTVEASVAEMIEKGKSENTYVWAHPKWGEIYVRCGGTSQYIEGKGYVLCGYHSDVTEIINSDMKQRQLLADALEDTKKQKKLLQEALDNYKQADYDRRTDFLTGLRNRQDMFELLQDTLSGRRDSIKAMFMMDIDNFKMLNDHYGHVAGDRCLQKIGAALTQYGKEHNMYFYRYGGEEMLGISFGSDKPDSETAQELVQLIYDLQLKRDDLERGVVTISLGYTSDNSEYEKMIDKADAAMYKAKANGKNQAVCYEQGGQ